MLRQKRRSRQFKEERESQIIDFEEARANRREKRAKQKSNKVKPEPKPAPSKRKQKLRRKRRRIVAFVLLILLVMVGISVGKVIMVKKHQNQVLQENKSLKETKKELETELDNVNNPEYIEEQARRQLNLMKPGEVVYIVPEKNDESEKKETGQTESDK